MHGIIRIGAVNCAEDPHLCQSQSVNSYPSLLLYPQVQKFTNILTIFLAHILSRS